MSKDYNDGIDWPPLGWQSLTKYKKRQGQSLVKDSQTARVRGLTYKIASDPLHVLDKNYYIHRLRIDSWEYTIQNDSNEYPVLRLKIMDRFDEAIPEEYYVSGIKAMACPVMLSEKSVRRTLQLMRFLLTQVDEGFVPDIEKALRMHRLHPLQLYANNEADRETGSTWPLSDLDSKKAVDLRYLVSRTGN